MLGITLELSVHLELEKTTLVDTLLGLLTPSEGQVLVNGKNITNSPDILWQNVAYLPQEIFIIDETVEQNIALGVPKNKIDQKQLMLFQELK